jgi:hypothetical protein
MLRLAGIALALAVVCCLAAPSAQGALAARAGCTASAPSAELRARVKARWLATAAGRKRAKALVRARAHVTARRRPSRSCPPRRPQPPAPPPAAGDPAPAPASQATSSPGGAGPLGVDAPPAAAPVRSTVGADAYDLGAFVLRLTRASVPAGALTIYFRNHDISLHNLWLAAPGSDTAPVVISDAVGESEGAAKTVAVTPGTWRLYCSLPGHESMSAALTVG